MNELETKLAVVLYECTQHKKAVLNAYDQIMHLLPLTVERYESLEADQAVYIDQFLYRFAKLQDSMGEKLFGTLLYLLGEDFANKPFIDMLNRLEKLGLLTKDEWLKLRSIRNDVAHEYAFFKEELVASLNEIFATKKRLVAIFDTFYDFAVSKFEFVKDLEEPK